MGKTYIEENIVSKHADDHPWVGQAWSKPPLPIRVGTYKNPGFYVYYTGGAQGYRGLARGLRYGFTLPGYRSETVVLHGLGHHFTPDTRVPNSQDAAASAGCTLTIGSKETVQSRKYFRTY